LHGQPDSSASFWSLRRELAARLPATVRVLAPDRPGYGANPAAATDFAGNVRWLRRWLDEIDAGPVVLCGHSWAGGVAALTAADPAEDRVRGLVLMSSVGPDCLTFSDPILASPVLGRVLAYASLGLAQPLVRRKVASVILSEQDEADRPYALASGLAMGKRAVWRSFLTEQRALLRELATINACLGRIAVPTRVLHGSSDSMIPARTPAALVEQIPDAVAVELEGGHDLQLRQPAPVAAALGPFVTELLERP
jgi:pimeloyl-ACP methyl ester carboxylesterase